MREIKESHPKIQGLLSKPTRRPSGFPRFWTAKLLRALNAGGWPAAKKFNLKSAAASASSAIAGAKAQR